MKKYSIKHSFIAAFITALLYILLMIISGITPFGDNSFLMFDMKRQYIDFYSFYKSVLTGSDSFLYSFSTTLGSGMIGFSTYYLSSPTLLILALFPRDYLPIGVSLVIGVKLILASFFMDCFLQYYICHDDLNLDNKDNYLSIRSLAINLGAITWSFCGFMISQSMNSMWIDVILLLPLLVICIDKVLIENRLIPYILCLALMLWDNYYISYQIMLFTVIWTLFRMWVLGVGKCFKKIGQMIISTILSICLCATTLIPTALELANSPKDITQLGLSLTGKNLPLREILSKLPTLSYDTIEARFGDPQIFCGVLFVIFTLVYLFNIRENIREKISILLMIIIMMMSLSYDFLNLIWHAGMEPSGHPYRQAYLLVFLMVICATKGLCSIALTDKRIAIAIPCALVIALAIFIYAMGVPYDHISTYTIYITYALLGCYTLLLCGFFVLRKLNITRFSGLIVCIIVLAQLSDITSNAVYTYHLESKLNQTRSEYTQIVSHSRKTVNSLKEIDGDFYRMENLTPRQQNDALQYGYNGVTHYSSAGMTYVRYFLQRLGFNDDGLYTHYGHDNTATMDSLLGIRYVISDGSVSPHPIYDVVIEDTVSAYKNPYSLPIAIGVNNFDTSGISMLPGDLNSDNFASSLPCDDPFSLQEDLYKRISGLDNNLFVDAITEEYYDSSIEKPNKTYNLTAAADGEMYMYINGLLGLSQGMTVFANDELVSTYGNASCIKILNLGYLNKGDTLTIRIESEEEDIIWGETLFKTELINNLSDMYESTCAGSNVSVTMRPAHLDISASDCNGIFLTIPCEEDWHIKVDGQKVQPLAVYGSLTYIPLSSDISAHNISMSFIPVGLYAGIIVSLISLIIIFFIGYREYLYEKKSSKMD